MIGTLIYFEKDDDRDVLRIFSSEVLMNIPVNPVNPNVIYTLLIY